MSWLVSNQAVLVSVVGHCANNPHVRIVANRLSFVWLGKIDTPTGWQRTDLHNCADSCADSIRVVLAMACLM